MLASFSVVCFILAVVLMLKRKPWRRTQAVLMLIAGLALAGEAGRIRDRLAELGSSSTATLSSKALGLGLSYSFALVVVVWWFLDMDLDGLVNKWRKSGKGSGKYSTTALTPWLALFVPVSLAVLPLVGGLSDELQRFGDQAALILLGG